MAISFVANATPGGSSTGANVSITSPTGTTTADVLLCVIANRGLTGGVSGISNGTHSFTHLGLFSGSSTVTVDVWYYVVQAGDSTSWTLTNTGNIEAGMTAYRGVDNSTPIDSQSTAGTTTLTINADTTTLANCWYIGCAAINSASNSVVTASSPSTLFTNARCNNGNGGGSTSKASLFFGDMPVAAAGSSGTVSLTSGTTPTTTYSFALRPASSGTDTVNVSDLAATSENIPLEVNSFPNVSDDEGHTEFVNIAEVDTFSVSDAQATSEHIQLEVNSFPNVSDLTTASENVIPLIPVLYENISDSIAASENTVLLNLELMAVSDSTVTSESVSTPIIDTIPIADTTVTSEAVVLVSTEFINVTDSTAISESVHSEVNSFIAVSDTTPTSETTAAAVADTSVVSDSVAASENVLVMADQDPSVSTSVATSESIVVSVPFYLVNVSDATTTADSLLLLDNDGIGDLDTAVLSESVVIQIGYTVLISDAITASESIARFITSPVIANDTAALAESVQIRTNNSVTVSDPVVVSEAASGAISETELVSDTAAAIESVSVTIANTASAYNVTVQDSISMAENFLTYILVPLQIIASDSVTMGENVNVVTVYLLNVTDTASSSEFLGFVYARTDDLNIQITQTNLTTETHDNLLTENGNLIATEQDGEQTILNESVIALLSGGSVSLSFLTIELLKLEVQPIALTLVQSVPILVTVVIA